MDEFLIGHMGHYYNSIGLYDTLGTRKDCILDNEEISELKKDVLFFQELAYLSGYAKRPAENIKNENKTALKKLHDDYVLSEVYSN